MAKVKYKGSTGEGGILEVDDPSLYTDTGNYELYTEPIVGGGGVSVEEDRQLPPPSLPTSPSPTPLGGGEIPLQAELQATRAELAGTTLETAESIRGRLSPEYEERLGEFKGIEERGLEESKEEEQQLRTGQVSRATGESGVLKGLGFSSAETGILAGIEDMSQRRVKTLERDMKNAVAKFDLDEQARLKTEIANERQMQRERESTLFNRLLGIKQVQMSEKQYQLAKAGYISGQSQQAFENEFNVTQTEFQNEMMAREDVRSQEELELARLKTLGELAGGGEAATTSYKEWTAAGGAEGTGIDYPDWLKQTKGITMSEADKINFSRKLANDFEKYAKDYRTSDKQIGVITTSYNDALGRYNKGESLAAASQGVLVAFQKLLDPTSVVRESEYARSAQGLSILDRLDALYTKLTVGGEMSPSSLRQFVELGQSFLNNAKREAVDFSQRINYQSGQWGLDINTILTPNALELLDVDIESLEAGIILAPEEEETGGAGSAPTAPIEEPYIGDINFGAT